MPLDEFHFAVNRVAPSLIRVQADEVTYNLHIMIRFDLERALISGALAVADLPEAWSAATRAALGVAPRNDAEGCLQDGHWADGMIGYFPTYTLGDVFAAQLYACAELELGDLGEQFARGEFVGVGAVAGAAGVRQGARHPSARLIEVVTGSPPDHRPLVRILRQKYEALYDHLRPGNSLIKLSRKASPLRGGTSQVVLLAERPHASASSKRPGLHHHWASVGRRLWRG